MAAAVSALGASAAGARGLETGFNDNLYLSGDGGVRDFVFDRTVDSEAGIIRVNVIWRNVAVGVPANPRDPADPAYNYGVFDTAVREAAERGLDVLLTIYSAPPYAEGPGRPAGTQAGTWRPDSAHFADFATATATRYSGAFAGLPRVRYYQAWNEPNLSLYLNPQYVGEAAESPAGYVPLLNAFYDAVKAVNPDNQVLTAGTAPYGDPPGGNRVRPLAFWRQVLCVEPGGCPTPARFDILAHHPINTSGSPRRSAIHPDDASTPDVHHLKDILRTAERQGTTGTGGRHDLWATELWWDSDPPDYVEGIALKRHARWIEEALYLLWKQGARAVINLQVRDIPFDTEHPFADTSTGLFFDDGRAKPAFKAFRFPFVTDRIGERRLRAWSRAPVGGRLKIERRQGGRWRMLKTLRVREGEIVNPLLRLSGRPRLRARIRGQRSLPWEQR